MVYAHQFHCRVIFRDVKGTDYVKVNLNKDRQMSAALRICKGLWTVDTHEALAQGARAKKQSKELGECGSQSWALQNEYQFSRSSAHESW